MEWTTNEYGTRSISIGAWRLTRYNGSTVHGEEVGGDRDLEVTPDSVTVGDLVAQGGMYGARFRENLTIPTAVLAEAIAETLRPRPYKKTTNESK